MLSRQGFVDDFRLRTFTFAFYRICSRAAISSLKECVSGRDSVSHLTFLRHLSPSLHILLSLELLGSLGVRVRPVMAVLVYFSVSLSLSLIWDTVRKETRCFGHTVCVRSFWEFGKRNWICHPWNCTVLTDPFVLIITFTWLFYVNLIICIFTETTIPSFIYLNVSLITERLRRLYEQSYRCFQNFFFFGWKIFSKTDQLINFYKGFSSKIWLNEPCLKTLWNNYAHTLFSIFFY